MVAVAVYETPLSWLDWWPGSTAGADAIATRGDPADAAERFVRRLVSDARWEKLPPSTREARRSEGPAMVGELVDLREHAPWSAEQVTVPVVAMYGERGAAHHRAGTEYLARELPDCDVVESRRPAISVRTRMPMRSPLQSFDSRHESATSGLLVWLIPERMRPAAIVAAVPDSTNEPPIPTPS